MQGLIYNLLADLAERAGCQDEAWDVALRSALGETEDEEEIDTSGDGDDEADEDEIPDLPPLGAATGTTFRCLLRSAAPFRDEDWDDLGEASSVSTRSEPGADDRGHLPNVRTTEAAGGDSTPPSALFRPRRR